MGRNTFCADTIIENSILACSSFLCNVAYCSERCARSMLMKVCLSSLSALLFLFSVIGKIDFFSLMCCVVFQTALYKDDTCSSYTVVNGLVSISNMTNGNF